MSELSPLDKKLQELALNDWEQFCMLTNVDKRHAEACLLRVEGKSLGQIAVKLKLTKRKVQEITNKCVPKNGTVS